VKGPNGSGKFDAAKALAAMYFETRGELASANLRRLYWITLQASSLDYTCSVFDNIRAWSAAGVYRKSATPRENFCSRKMRVVSQ